MTTPTNDEKELDEILSIINLTFGTDAKLTEIGWERLDENLEEAKQQLQAWRDRELVRARLYEVEELPEHDLRLAKNHAIRERISTLRKELYDIRDIPVPDSVGGD